MADPAPFSLKPRAAIDFLRNKVGVPTKRWDDLWEDMHGAAFMVAGAQKAALIEDFHQAVIESLETGETLEQFRERFDTIVAEHGWNYNGSRNWRSSVIFHTNQRMAYAAGRWQAIQRVKKNRPYIHYIAVRDNRTRPHHLELHNIVLPVDHSFWLIFFPPNGWNCRCRGDSISESDLKRLGLEVSEDPIIDYEKRIIQTPNGEEEIWYPKGIATGFAYNPGVSGFGRGAGQKGAAAHGGFKMLEGLGSRPSAPLPDVAPVDPIGKIFEAAADEDEMRDILREVLGGEEKIFVDPVGERVRVTQAVIDQIIAKGDQAIKRERYFGLIPELLEQPQEVWLGFVKAANGKVYLRRRYIRIVRISNTRVVALVSDTYHGEFVAMTFYEGSLAGLKNLRTGLRLYSE